MITTERPQEAYVDTVQKLRPVIEAHRDDAERERRLSDAVVQTMEEAGLFKLWVPREYGGDELDLPTFLEMVEATSAIDGAAGWVLANVVGNGMQAAFLPKAGAIEIFGRDPGAPKVGAVMPRGRAVADAAGYRVTGQWQLVSGSHHASWLGLGTLIFDGDGPRLGPNGMPDLKIMFFPAADCEVLDTWYSTGLRGTGSTDVLVRSAVVPDHRTFSPFTGEPQVSGALYRVGVPGLFTFALTAVGLGIARGALNTFVEVARVKTPTLNHAGLASRPTIHAELARAEAKVQSARAYLMEVAHETMRSAANGNVPDKVEARWHLACLNSAASCEEAVDTVFRLAGSTSIYTGNRLDQCLRDIHTANQHLVVNPIWWEKTGQYYLGLGLGMP
jgi:alkylation response protein AidB-like acyl-CoA dehydrogenase